MSPYQILLVHGMQIQKIHIARQIRGTQILADIKLNTNSCNDRMHFVALKWIYKKLSFNRNGQNNLIFVRIISANMARANSIRIQFYVKIHTACSIFHQYSHDLNID
ncbi:hypothetical protein pb186bvf_015516 [Paramecium bursaria]